MSIRPRPSGLLAALFVLGIIAGPAAVAAKSEWSESSPAPVGDASLDVQLRLSHGHYDPARSLPPLPPALRSGKRQSDGMDYFIVQFEGPIRQAWRERLEASGATVMDYLPDYAYIVRMNGDAYRNVSEVDGVRWMGIYETGFRLSPELIAVSRSPGSYPGPIDLVVRAFRDEPVQGVVDRLAQTGVIVTGQSADSGGGAIFQVSASAVQLQDLAAIDSVAWIERELEPAFSNSIARSDMIMNQDRIESELGLFGSGQIVAVGDSGLDTGNAATVHADFNGRVIGGTWGGGSCGTWADANSHGTHVAGSVAGSGALSGADIPGQDYSGSHAGIAPEAELYIWNFCNNFSGLPNAPYSDYYGVKYAVDAQLRVANNSWGYTVGQGGYNTFTRETDRFVADHPDMVLVYAAGNDGEDGNADGVIDPNSVNMPSTAKNVITVGASENVRMSGGLNPGGPCSTWGTCWPGDFPANPINSDRISDDLNGMAAFSGRGPTGAGRIKPDLVAPGTNIISARNYSIGTGWGIFNADYLYMGGTSMAAPLVAGASAVVREFYDQIHGLANPGAALIKATLVNGAVDMTPGQYGLDDFQEILGRPDFSQGFGRVDLPGTLIFDNDRKLYFHEHAGLATNDTFQATFTVTSGGAPFRAALVWTDTAGTEASLGALVNDLDLEIETPGGVLHRGNGTHTGGAADRDNNVEIVGLPAEDGEYTMTVRGHNVPDGPQSFAVVVSYQGTEVPLGELQGTVQSEGAPLEGVTISASGPGSMSTISSSNGNYSLALEEGSYEITASRFGYVSQTVDPVLIVSGEVQILDFDLQPAPMRLATYCTAPGVAIPDDNPAGVDSFLSVPDDESLVLLNAYVVGTHSWVGDLRVELTHPSGAPTVVMIDRPGIPELTWGCGSSDFDVWLDDSGIDGPVQDQCFAPPALHGRAIPNAPLAAFNGLNAQGEWTLNISDNASDDTGTLNEWCLEIGLPTYRVGGTVSGLSGSDLVLQNNGEDDLVIEENGSFEFATTLVSGEAYAVTVLTDPGSPEQVCTVNNGEGTVDSADVADIEVVCVTNEYGIGGTVTGLLGEGLVLQNNSGDDLPITDNGSFVFSTPVESGSGYAVTVLTQPTAPSQTCSVSGGTGTVAGEDVTSVEVSCATDQFTVGGNVSGLVGSGLVLLGPEEEELAISNNGSFTFSASLNDGSTYAVSVLNQPNNPDQYCLVIDGSGELGGVNVVDVEVSCLDSDIFQDRFEMTDQ